MVCGSSGGGGEVFFFAILGRLGAFCVYPFKSKSRFWQITFPGVNRSHPRDLLLYRRLFVEAIAFRKGVVVGIVKSYCRWEKWKESLLYVWRTLFTREINKRGVGGEQLSIGVKLSVKGGWRKRWAQGLVCGFCVLSLTAVYCIAPRVLSSGGGFPTHYNQGLLVSYNCVKGTFSFFL